MVGLAEEALDRRLIVHQRDDDLAVGRGVLRAHDDVVALEDSDVAHRLAAHAQHVLARLAPRQVRHLHVLLDVLLGQDRLAGRDVADQRQPRPDRAAHAVDHVLHGTGEILTHAVQQLDGARLGRIAAQQPEPLEVGEMRVDGRRGRQADGLADVPDGRRVAVLSRVALDEVEYLLLALGQVHERSPRRDRSERANMCSTR
jgi:hypothetical protein